MTVLEWGILLGFITSCTECFWETAWAVRIEGAEKPVPLCAECQLAKKGATK